jgi:hypothetical protein
VSGASMGVRRVLTAQASELAVHLCVQGKMHELSAAQSFGVVVRKGDFGVVEVCGRDM